MLYVICEYKMIYKIGSNS